MIMKFGNSLLANVQNGQGKCIFRNMKICIFQNFMLNEHEDYCELFFQTWVWTFCENLFVMLLKTNEICLILS
jgi:hypothetical protein